MSCDEFVYDSFGRRGIGVIQPQSGLNYPFVNPSNDIRSLFADFYLAYDEPAEYDETLTPFSLPFRLKWITGFGCQDNSASSEPGPNTAEERAADLIVVDAEERIVFDSTAADAPTTRSWSDVYQIYEWHAAKIVCRAVVYTAWPPDEKEPKNYPTTFEPENAVLDARAVYRMPRRVLSLKVKNGNIILPPVTGSDITFAAGNNFELVSGRQETVGFRRRTEITFNVVAGAGAGKYSDCRAAGDGCGVPVTLLNGASPNQYGDLIISGKSCLWVRTPTTRNTAGTAVTPVSKPTVSCDGVDGTTKILQIGTNCLACCDCEDYVDLANYMNRTRDRYKIVGQRTREVKLLHENNIERWIEQRDCRLAKPLKIQIVPQHCPFIDVVLQYCNQCFPCAENVKLNVDFSAFPANFVGHPVCGNTFLFAPNVPGLGFDLDGAWPSFSARIGNVDIGTSAYVKFRLKILPFDYPASITGTLSGTYGIDNTPIIAGCAGGPAAEASATNALYCDENGDTAIPCRTPEPKC